MKKISIIVPAYNEEKLLPATLAAIRVAEAALAKRGWSTELIVCDNNSSDRTGALAAAAGARVVFEPVNQIGRARNRGASVATGDWLIFVDADTQPSAALFDAVSDAIQSGKVLAGGSTFELDSQHRHLRILTSLWLVWSRMARHMAGSFIFVDAGAFREIGGFNHELFAAEEIDLSRRLKRLAKTRKQRIAILTGHSLKTSGRKAELYSGREIARFLFKAAFRPRQVLSKREACSIWYDGRR